MIDEIFRTYLIILFNADSDSKRIILSKDIIEVAERLLKRLEHGFKDTIFWNKLRLLKIIAKHASEGKNLDILLDKIFLEQTKFHAFRNEVLQLKNTKPSEVDLQYLEKQLTFEKQYIASEEYLQKFKCYIEKIENREFEGVDEIENELKSIIEELYMGFIRETNLAKSLDGMTTIDYDDPNILLNKMSQFYSGKNYISTGFKNLDKLFGGGFERTRLYLLAGKPGCGKSTFLINFVKNIGKDILNGKYLDQYILYVTHENLALETNQRLLCSYLNLSQFDINNILKSGDSKNIIKEAAMKFKNMNIVIVYYPARTFGTMDLFSLIENLNMQRKQKPLVVFEDYLDLMKLPSYITEFRHQLGDITLGLKTLAVTYKIPVISVTQLLKSAYGNKPHLGDVKESSEKIDHSDAVGLISKLSNMDNEEDQIMQFGYNTEIVFEKSRSSGDGSLRFAMTGKKFLIEEERDPYSSSKPQLSYQQDAIMPAKTIVSKIFNPPTIQTFKDSNEPNTKPVNSLYKNNMEIDI